MLIRKITEAEKTDFAVMTTYAFKDWKDEPPKEEMIEALSADQTFAVFDNGRMVAGLINHDMKQVVRGVIKSMSGIGCVSCYPEYRGKGLVWQLMQVAFKEMMAKSQPLSMLRPFKQSFYDKFNYVETGYKQRITYPMSAIAHYLENLNLKEWEFQRFDAGSNWDEFLEVADELALKQYHGYVLFSSISEGRLKRFFKDSIVVIVRHEGKAVGSFRYYKKGFGTDGVISIADWFYSDAYSRSAIFHYLALHRDQCGKFRLPVPGDAPFYTWFKDADTNPEATLTCSPWMVRVMDIPVALEGLPATDSGEITIKVTDPTCDWNNGAYLLVSDGETLSAESVSTSADCHLTIEGLSTLVYGSMNIEELVARKWLFTESVRTKQLLTSWFPMMSIYNICEF
ncbi:MAG: GNAT family N-acetyltransferase [Candidatus Cloacimonetes bacterium]|nr:GNAT family N-acetyltransferase [Candidatus Cloacimonadota bacterium]